MGAIVKRQEGNKGRHKNGGREAGRQQVLKINMQTHTQTVAGHRQEERRQRRSAMMDHIRNQLPLMPGADHLIT